MSRSATPLQDLRANNQPPNPGSSFEKDRRNLARNSQYPSVSSQAYIDLLPKKSSHKPSTATSILDITAPNPLPVEPQPDITDCGPNNAFRLTRQVEIIHSLRSPGPSGFALYLYEECRKFRSGATTQSSTWDTIIDDQDNGTFYAVLPLSVLPKNVMESLIKGTLMHDIRTDRDVRQ